MYFEFSKMEDVTRYVQKRATNMGIKYSDDDILLFDAIIASIKDNRKNNGKSSYIQGEDIDPEDQKNIREAVQGLVEAEKERLLAKANDPKQPLKAIKSVAEYFATFTDFYYVRAMKELGCPNMPLFMFDKGFKKTIEDSAIAVHGAKVSYDDVKTNNVYPLQRYTDAAVLDEALTGIFDKIDKNHHSPREVGMLIAQYQALDIRQLNHGAIWRFFHPGENKARTELLQKMSTYIQKALPEHIKGIQLNRADPVKVARGIANHNIKSNVEYALTDRFTNRVEETYGCQASDEILMEPHLLEDEDEYEFERVPLIEVANIINDVNIENSKNIDKSEPVVAKSIDKSEPVVGKSQDNIILDGLLK